MVVCFSVIAISLHRNYIRTGHNRIGGIIRTGHNRIGGIIRIGHTRIGGIIRTGHNRIGGIIRTGHNRIGGIMVSVLHLNALDYEFEHRSGQIKDYEISIGCFPTLNAALRSKSKDWLARNQNYVSKLSDMSAYGLLIQ